MDHILLERASIAKTGVESTDFTPVFYLLISRKHVTYDGAFGRQPQRRRSERVMPVFPAFLK